MIGREDDCWTPRRVRDCLIEALAWVKRSGGPVGPAGIKSCMPSYAATLEDHLEEGWGLPESADEAETGDGRTKKIFIPPTSDMVEDFVRRLSWVSLYVHPTNPGSARMLALWLRCRIDRRDFGQAVDALRVGRSHAYRLRDRGLSMIAAALQAERNDG